jgi:hypothetical protein
MYVSCVALMHDKKANAMHKKVLAQVVVTRAFIPQSYGRRLHLARTNYSLRYRCIPQFRTIPRRCDDLEVNEV